MNKTRPACLLVFKQSRFATRAFDPVNIVTKNICLKKWFRLCVSVVQKSLHTRRSEGTHTHLKRSNAIEFEHHVFFIVE